MRRPVTSPPSPQPYATEWAAKPVPTPPVRAVPRSFDATTSLPVVTVTLCGPTGAFAATLIGTDASVGPLTVTVPAVMPVPKNALVTPDAKFVNAPFSVTVVFVPWTTETGEIEKTVG